ncbi:universal stress protein [Micromonospora sp. NBC_01796]|uniref:universal stress protein n=1 Tax=Micromonospora sp. NBC_01796 TaxID=2975987 RepID=UPI002DD7DDF5|nr:universal stress protein [Micromonospora sp. NBC_01796]WSA88376.1 universal stress protein [Micromonospora sp. NBC_01796]
MTTRPILVGYDGSPSAWAALAWAVDEAARAHRSVLLAYSFEWFNVTAPVVPEVANWSDLTARRDAQAMVVAAAAEAAKSRADVAVSAVLLDGPPAVALAEQSRQAALLVVGNRGHGGFADLLVGSTSVAVAAHAHCPVVVVRGVEPDPEDSGRRIVVGFDGSQCSLLALGYAFDLAMEWEVPLHVIAAWTPPPPQYVPVAYNPVAVTNAERAALDDLLVNWRQKHPEVAVTTEVVADTPGRALVNASRNAQLVVVGSRGHGGFGGLLLGSVSQQLLHHSRCPVAVVREIPPSTEGPDDN